MSLNWGVPKTCSESQYRSLSAMRWWPGWLPWPFNRKDPIDSLVADCEPRYFPIPGVHVEVDSPGLTHGFDYLDYVEGIGVYGTKYFHDLIVELRRRNYVEGDTLVGHPFDWRYPTWQLSFNELKATIENFVKSHPEKKVVIIAHSLGNTFSIIQFWVSSDSLTVCCDFHQFDHLFIAASSLFPYRLL